MIGVGFLGSTPRENDANICRNAVQLSNFVCKSGVCYTDSGGKDLSDDFCAYGLTYALGTVARECVRNFVSHNYGNATIVLGDRHYTLPERHLAARQAKRVYLFYLGVP